MNVEFMLGGGIQQRMDNKFLPTFPWVMLHKQESVILMNEKVAEK